MQSIRIVSTGAVVAMAVMFSAGGAAVAQTATDRPGQPLSLQSSKPRAATVTTPAFNAGKTAGTNVTKTKKKLASKKPKNIAATPAADVAAPLPSDAAATTPWPQVQPVPAAASPPATDATATAMENQSTGNAAADNAAENNGPRTIVFDGQTVQVAGADEVNAIDLAADDSAAPASQSVLAASAHDDSGQTSQSWLAQMLAMLGGAATAAAVGWFLIGAGPLRMYG